MSEQQRIPRRSFLKGSAGGLAAASALPAVLGLAGCEGPAKTEPVVEQVPQTPSPGLKLTVGLIGCGDLGRRHHLARYLTNDQRMHVAAVCDVDANHRDEAAAMVLAKNGHRPAAYEDFRQLLDRKDIDAVVIVVPDHWHALASVTAMEAGKDVYCEKPLSLTIDDGKKMVAAARRYGAVFQTGSMQRSDKRFRKACELVRNGKIGKIHTVHTYIGNPPKGQWQPYQTPPPNLNWDFWLGPAPYADYFPNRCHYEFRWFEAYSGGKMTDWGAHHNDIAQWGLGMDESGPVEVRGKGEYNPDGPYDVARSFEVHYKYANGVELICHAEGPNGARFEGDGGWIFVNRGKIEASDPAILETPLGPNDIRLYNTGDHDDNWINHYNNWLSCIETRQHCICDVAVGHRSATVCHLGNIAIRLGRTLKWDPAKEAFVGDTAANDMMSRPYRAPWHL